MKHILALLFSLVSLAAFSQEITTDTSFIITSGGNFIEVRRIVYDNGTYSEQGQLIGDTIAMQTRTAASISDQAATLSRAARTIFGLNKTLVTLLATDTITTARLNGRSPITALMLNYEKEFIGERSTAADNPTWSIANNGGAAVNVTFPLQASSNRIRFQANGVAARNFIALGDMVIIVGYPNAGRNILFRPTATARRFRSIDGAVILSRR